MWIIITIWNVSWQVHFEHYNVRIERDSIHELLDWTPYDAVVDKFKREHIYQSIINSEINEMSYPKYSYNNIIIIYLRP